MLHSRSASQACRALIGSIIAYFLRVIERSGPALKAERLLSQDSTLLTPRSCLNCAYLCGGALQNNQPAVGSFGPVSATE